MCFANSVYGKWPKKGEIRELEADNTIELPPDTPMPQRPYDK